jgi:hypothetical protein
MDAKCQTINKDGIISHITDPQNKVHLKLVSLNEFSKCEFDNKETDYCTIVGDKLFISSKAKYDYAIIHYAKNHKHHDT